MTPPPSVSDLAKGRGIRITLLPPEIVEKRKAESRRLVFVAVGFAIIALLGIAWAFLALFVGIKTGEVASAQQQAASLRAQAASFKVFEDRAGDLKARQAVADRALAGRIEWSQLMGDLSLVLPPDIWLETFEGDQATAGGAAPSSPAASASGSGSNSNLLLTGWSLDVPVDKANGGFKSIAQLLVRLDDLSMLKNVWLTSAEVVPGGFRAQDAIKWSSSSEVVVPSSSASASASSVPGAP